MAVPVELLWLLATAPAAGPGCDAVLEGRIVDAATGSAVARADVRIEAAGRAALARTTAEDGTYRFEELCPGTYALAVGRADYLAVARSIGVPGEQVDVALEPRDVGLLEDVVVVAPARAALPTASAHTLEGEALDRARGRNLADALADVSGVTVLRSPAGGLGKPIIRGQVGQRNLVLYDGVRHESQDWGIDHAPEVDPFSAGSITVLKGAAAIRYGPDAVGGVVLLEPPPLPEAPGISGEAHLVGVSNGLMGIAALRLQGAHARLPGFAWRVEGNVARGASRVTPDYVLDNTASRTWNVGATLGYARRGFSIYGTYRHHDMRAGIFSGLRVESHREFLQSLALERPPEADLYRQEYAIERPFQAVAHELGLVRGRTPVGEAGAFVATYAVQFDDRDEYDVVRDGTSGPQFEFDLLTHAADLVFEQAPRPLGRTLVLEGSVGGTYAYQRNRFDGSDPNYLPDYRQHGGGVFLVERFVLPRLEIEAGARYDALWRLASLHEDTFDTGRRQGRLPDDCRERSDGGGDCPNRFHGPAGSVGVLLRPVPELVFKTELTSGLRFPTVDEQYIKGASPSFPVVADGDATLDPERVWGASLTLDFANTWAFVQGSAYFNTIQDYIYFRAVRQERDPIFPEESDCAPLRASITGCVPAFEPTGVDAFFYGGEISTTLAPPSWPVQIDARGSWVRARQRVGGEALVFIPPDRYQVGLSYHWPDFGPTEDGFVGLEGVFVDRQRNYDVDADFAAPPPAYAILGAQAGIAFPVRGQRIALGLVGHNLTNARYRDYTSLLRYFANEPGWELLVRLTLEFDAPARGRSTGTGTSRSASRARVPSRRAPSRRNLVPSS